MSPQLKSTTSTLLLDHQQQQQQLHPADNSPTSSCYSPCYCQTPTSTGDSLDDGSINGHSMVILDWDDTIVPTQALISHGGKLSLSSAYTSVVEAFLSLLLELTNGNVCILSSSTEGWVKESCKIYLPRLLPVLSNIKVIHTPKQHLQRGIKQKEASAVKIASEWYSHLPKGNEGSPSSQVLLIGNQIGDISPSKMISSLLPNTSVKTCLLKTHPSVQDIQRQLTYLYYSLISILTDDGNHLDYSVADASSEAILDLYAADIDNRYTITVTRREIQECDDDISCEGRQKSQHNNNSNRFVLTTA
ncbi:hypothetical protein FOL47_007840 [Perkinsus chesapeaki]|uniref:Uncharacterized protein n=1 Tax=Perkinsus chesapeaki TaxID=330153 RepID=A0A7J6MUU1_PERCH|nr:hypothetical protein FOL47_007840 [Perkinsus chesapeaki]